MNNSFKIIFFTLILFSCNIYSMQVRAANNDSSFISAFSAKRCDDGSPCTPSVVQALLEAGFDPNHPVPTDCYISTGGSLQRIFRTSLEIASMHLCEESIKLLVAAGANTRNGAPLVHAVRATGIYDIYPPQIISILRFLLDNGANPLATENDNAEFEMNAQEIIQHRIKELKKWMERTNCREYSGYLKQRHQIAHILNLAKRFQHTTKLPLASAPENAKAYRHPTTLAALYKSRYNSLLLNLQCSL